MNWPAKSRKNNSSKGLLGPAIERTRAEAPRERLSASARQAILRQALSPEVAEIETLPGLFTPVRRLWLAGATPLLLAGAMVALLGPWRAVDRPVQVQVNKDGQRVVFTIANGKSTHRVYKSTAADRFDPASEVLVTDAAFVDPIDPDDRLVFYRIE